MTKYRVMKTYVLGLGVYQSCSNSTSIIMASFLIKLFDSRFRLILLGYYLTEYTLSFLGWLMIYVLSVSTSRRI